MNIPIFCINLKRATERKDNIKKEWIDKLGFDINFWEACDRRTVQEHPLYYTYNQQKTISNMNRLLSDGEIACAISFRSLYKYLLSNNYKQAIIMEDDVVPLFNHKMTLTHTIQKGQEEFPEADMMLLHEYPYANKEKVYSIVKDVFSKCYESPWGNQLFYINEKALIDIYNLLQTIEFPADYPQLILSKQNRVIIVNKALCYHEWSGPNSTTYIGNELRNTSRKFYIQ